MVIAIREGSDIPIYQQIRDQIVLGISDGRLKPREQLPTVRALAEEIGINSMTVNKAYQLLKQQGYIIADRRNGARVSKNFGNHAQLSLESYELLRRISAEAKLSGMTQEKFLEECRNCYQNDGSDLTIEKYLADCPQNAQSPYFQAEPNKNEATKNTAFKPENKTELSEESYSNPCGRNAEHKSGADCEKDFRDNISGSKELLNGKEDYVYA